MHQLTVNFDFGWLFSFSDSMKSQIRYKMEWIQISHFSFEINLLEMKANYSNR
jgi:hypothetical protein